MAYNTNDLPSSDPLVNRFFLSTEEKAKKETGKAIVKKFYQAQTANDSNFNFYKARNARQIMLLLWAKGSQPMKEFLDYMNVSDGNKAWVNMDMTQQRLGPQFVRTLVESMAKNKTYACVEAVDDGSVSEKEDRMLEAIFRMQEIDFIKTTQEQAGVQMEPSNAYVPNDILSAQVYFQLEDRLPKEIRFEKMLACIQDDIRFENILNKKTLHDGVVLGMSATKIERIAPKKYTVRKCIMTNMVYNFFMNDTGECEVDMIGEFYNIKVKDLRSRLGKSEERPDGMTEKEIFDMAKVSTFKNIGTFNYMWDDRYALNTYNWNRPYDDCSILVFDTEINCGEDVYYVSKPDAYGKEDIQKKKSIPYQQKTKDGEIINQAKPDNVEIIKRNKKQWMRGVYAPYADKMLYWGDADLIISQYTDTANPLSSYTINIVNNDGEYVPSLFERIMEPLREYSLVKLKRKQLIAKIRPTGIRIDVENVRNLDLGSGDTIAWEEVVRIFDQTGNELWSSKGLDPLKNEAPPLSNTVQDVTVQKIVELTNVLAGIVQEIRQLIGVPQYRDGSDVGDRTSGVLQEQQESASYNVTDDVLHANNELWEETFNKLCLLYWNDVVKEEPESKDDLLNTRFKTTVKMKSTEYEKAQLEKDIAQYSQVPDSEGNPSITPKDAFRLRQIENGKLAEWYLTSTYEDNRKRAAADKDKREQANIQSQQASATQANEQAAQIQTDKLAAEKDMLEFKSTKEKELALLTGWLAAAAKDESGKLLTQFLPAIQQLVPNITIPLTMENKQMGQAIMQSQQPPQQQPQSPQEEQQEPVQEPQQQEQQEPVM